MFNSRVFFIFTILFSGILIACANVTPAPTLPVPTPQPAVAQPTAAPPTTAPLPTKPAPTSAQPTPTDNPPAVNLPPLDPALAKQIAGKYAKELSDKELSDAGVDRNTRLFLQAKWDLELTPDGRAIFWQDTGSFKSVVMEAPFSFSGDTLLLGTDKGDYGCFNLGVMAGKYQYKLTENELIFTTIQDECPRHFLMTLKPWVKVGAASNSSSTVVTPAAAAPFETIAGVYAKSLWKSQLKDAGANEWYSGALQGKWQMELTTDGKVRLATAGIGDLKNVLDGSYTLTADTLTFGEDSGPYACAEQAGVKSGAYHWKLDGAQLVMTTIQDECERRFVMTTEPWVKQGNAPQASSPRTAPTRIVERGDKEWDYVSMGDSFQDASNITQIFSDYLEQDLGVKVKHTFWGTLGKPRLVIQVRDDPEFRQAIQEAEVITLNWQPAILNTPTAKYQDGTCGGADNEDCLRAAVQEAQQDWDALLDEITKLKSPREALIRTYYFGSWPIYAYYDSYGASVSDAQMQVEIKYMRAMDEHVAASAAARGIPVVNLFELFQDSDPNKKAPAEYFSDKLHLNKQGSTIVTEGLRALGYGYAVTLAR